MTLGRGPQLDLAVLAVTGDRGLRLDIALMDRLGVEFALDDQIGLGESRLDVAGRELDALGDVRRLFGRGLHPGGDLVLVQQRRVVLHRLDDVDDVRQHLVVDPDQLERLARDRIRGRGDRRHGVAVIERLLARHHVAGHVAEIDDQLARGGVFDRHFREVVAGDHRLDPGQRLGRRGVDRDHPGMGVGAPEHPAEELARQVDVRAVAGAAGHLVHAVGADRARADDLEVLVLVLEHRGHDQPPLISAAASWTASTIL